MSKSTKTAADSAASIIILFSMTIVAIGCILGISYLIEYNFYEPGDNGRTAKSVAVQIYSLEDVEQAKDFYNCYYEEKDDYQVSYYEGRFSPEKTNFVFYVTDTTNEIYYTNSLNDKTVTEEYKKAEYSGSSSHFIYDENGKTIPLRINYYIETDTNVDDKYSSAFRWIDLADTLKYFLFVALCIAVVIVLVMLSIITINAGIKDGEVEPGFIDKIPLDICVLFMGVVFSVSWIILGLTTAANVGMVLNNLIIIFTVVIDVIIIMSFLSTLSVRIKMGKLYKNTIVYRVIRKFKRKTPRKVRRVFKEISVFKKLMFGIVIYVVFEAAILISATYFGLVSKTASPSDVLIIFLITWGITRLIMIPVFSMVAINLHYVKEEGQRLAEGVLGDEITKKLTIASFRAHGQNLEVIRQEINKAMEQELRSEKLKNELITNVSHDIKTPLTSIVNYVEILKTKTYSEEEEQKYLDIISNQSHKLNRLLEDLIVTSQISTGSIELNKEKMSLNIIIGQTIEEFADKLEKSELLPRVFMPENDIYITADGHCLWRVISNLISNACKYSKPGTDVIVSLEEIEDKAVVRISNISKSKLDTEQTDLKERFVRGDSSRHTEGNGLGLSIANTLTELQGGELDIDFLNGVFEATLRFDLA